MTPLPLGCSKQRCPVAGGKCHGFGLHLQCSRQTRDGRAPASAGARVESRWDLSTCWARPGGAARSKQFLIDAIEDLRWILNDFTVDYYRCYRWFIGCLGSWRTFCFEMGCEGVVKFFFCVERIWYLELLVIPVISQDFGQTWCTRDSNSTNVTELGNRDTTTKTEPKTTGFPSLSSQKNNIKIYGFGSVTLPWFSPWSTTKANGSQWPPPKTLVNPWWPVNPRNGSWDIFTRTRGWAREDEIDHHRFLLLLYIIYDYCNQYRYIYIYISIHRYIFIYLLLCSVIYYYCYYQHCCIFIHLPICDGLYVDWSKKGIAIPRGYAAYANDFLLLILSHSHTSMPMFSTVQSMHSNNVPRTTYE